MTDRRDGTFVWATWLSKLMAGEISCEWAPWFRSHFQRYSKAPSDFDQATWRIKHTRCLRDLRVERETAGDQIFIEGQTQFYFERRDTGLLLSGRPDLIGISGYPAT